MSQFDTLLNIYEYIRPVLDIGILTFLFYKAYDLISRTNALQLITAALIVLLFYAGVYVLNLQTLMWLFRIMAPGLLIAFAIV